MDVKNKCVENDMNLIQNKARGEISYYSINQVADLLNEDLSNIKYYTNIFDDLLKIEIVNKELQYKNEDINKLDFLIRLKNKGMTIKEIEEYYNKISLNEEEVKSKTSNLLSVEQLISSVIEAQNKEFEKLKSSLINDIKEVNSEYLKNITSSLIESQTKSFNKLKDDVSTEIKDCIDSKFKVQNETLSELQNEMANKINTTLSEKIDVKNEETISTLHNDFEEFSKASLVNSENLVNEVHSFKRVIKDAYYIHTEMKEPVHEGFFNKLVSLFSK